jgi:agmatinase
MNELPEKKNFLGLKKRFSSYNNSSIVIIQAPLEKTVSYGKGTRKGPSEILKASHYVEFFDEELTKELCYDKGICTLEEINFENLSIAKSIDKIYREVKKHIKAGKFIATLGGEQSLSLATIKAHFDCYDDMSILQIDAHSDLRDSYEGSKYSHASVMARVAEFTKDIVQVGIRAQSKEEYDFIKASDINTFYSRGIRTDKYGKRWQNKVVDLLNQNVYITFDVDGLDPSVIPGTGTPEPGGLFWDETMNLLRLIGEKRNVVGFDIVEVAPNKNDSVSSFNAAKLTYKMLNYSFSK